MSFEFVPIDEGKIETLRYLLEKECDDISNVDSDTELAWFLISRYIHKMNGSYEIKQKANNK